MKKYKCLADDMYPFIQNEIYSGDFIAPRYLCTVENYVAIFPKKWEEVKEEEVKEETPKKPLDLTKILKGCEGQTLYCTLLGEVTLDRILDYKEYPIELCSIKTKSITTLSKEGIYLLDECGECILFPSKENRDWSTFKPKIPFGTPVMVSNNGTYWKLKKYNGFLQNTYIVPVDKFDFSNFEANKY